ncbi:hypothetical protein D3C81_2102100 [compost metagenome]
MLAEASERILVYSVLTFVGSKIKLAAILLTALGLGSNKTLLLSGILFSRSKRMKFTFPFCESEPLYLGLLLLFGSLIGFKPVSPSLV